ncbi:hypothetical protein HW561_16470 [Rhodobacteraceae bacterium B1Z28]|uniref:Uncharacterized protein n=1 Tax=Ruegeria haliotis TaxID=2747601 RepID=A0ABX2PUQ1_9RHOB|nr:hypothetical protein [Ruegeria haliotis]NVO57391.1 hypothetical protein [Ruegeria haliotis]
MSKNLTHPGKSNKNGIEDGTAGQQDTHPTHHYLTLRGGRMTKVAGIAASCAPMIGVIGTGIVAMVLTTASPASAGQCTNGIGGPECVNGVSPDDTPQSFLLGLNEVVDIIDDFGIATTGTAFTLTQSSVGDLVVNGSGSQTITDADRAFFLQNSANSVNLTATIGGQITGTASHGVEAINDGTGQLSLTLPGTVSGGAAGHGVLATIAWTSLSLNLGTVTGGLTEITAINNGDGALNISAGTVIGNGGDAITAVNSTNGTGLTITTTGAVSGTADGIDATNNGTGSLHISTQTVVAQNGDGIKAENFGTDLIVDASNSVVEATGHGIIALNRGSGDLIVNAHDVRQSTVTDTAFGTGILAINDGRDLSVTTTGSINGDTNGIEAANFGSGSLSVNSATVAGQSLDGIHVENTAGKPLSPILRPRRAVGTVFLSRKTTTTTSPSMPPQ